MFDSHLVVWNIIKVCMILSCVTRSFLCFCDPPELEQIKSLTWWPILICVSSFGLLVCEFDELFGVWVIGVIFLHHMWGT